MMICPAMPIVTSVGWTIGLTAPRGEPGLSPGAASTPQDPSSTFLTACLPNSLRIAESILMIEYDQVLRVRLQHRAHVMSHGSAPSLILRFVRYIDLVPTDLAIHHASDSSLISVVSKR